MICYSDATVPSSNHAPKASLDSSRDLHGGCGGGFVIRLHLIL